MTRTSRIEIDAAAVAHNAAVFRGVLGGQTGLGAVVKADAYGHGLLTLLPALHPLVDALYVITSADALAIRAWETRVGRAPVPVLVLGVIEADEVVALARAGVRVVLGDPGWRAWIPPLRGAGLQLGVDVHIDSGLGREGFLPESVRAALDGVAEASDVLDVVGVMTHFADTEDVTEQTYALRQLREFDRGVAEVEALVGRAGLQRHTAASAPTLVLPDARREVVRVGIAFYGLWPSRETRISTLLVRGELPRLDPVLSWRVESQLVKDLPAGSFVGYGCTHRCTHDTRIAVLPVGYYDGYPRSVSHRAHVLVAGRRCAVLGRVMMNHIIVDVTDVPWAGPTVVATLLGRDGGEEVSADDLAGWAGTINYEIVARLGSHLPRVLVAGAERVG